MIYKLFRLFILVELLFKYHFLEKASNIRRIIVKVYV